MSVKVNTGLQANKSIKLIFIYISNLQYKNVIFCDNWKLIIIIGSLLAIKITIEKI